MCSGTSHGVIQKGWSVERLGYSLFSRYQSEWFKCYENKYRKNEIRNISDVPRQEIGRDSSDDEEPSNHKWSRELDWLSKALEPALDFWRWALPTGLCLLSFVRRVHGILPLLSV